MRVNAPLALMAVALQPVSCAWSLAAFRPPRAPRTSPIRLQEDIGDASQFEVEYVKPREPVGPGIAPCTIKVIGVGGGGGNTCARAQEVEHTHASPVHVLVSCALGVELSAALTQWRIRCYACCARERARLMPSVCTLRHDASIGARARVRHRRLNRMVEEGPGGEIVQRASYLEYVACNTDVQALSASFADARIQLGKNAARGLGAGGIPSVGRASAIDATGDIEDAVRGTDMVFVTAGMGGGTGSGAAPVVAELAKQAGALTVHPDIHAAECCHRPPLPPATTARRHRPPPPPATATLL